MRSSLKGLAIAVLIAASAVTYFVWKHEQEVTQEERTQQAEAAEEKRIATLVKEMVSRWNGITDWEGSFDRSDTSIFTVELEKAIVRSRPILIYASVDDVKHTNGTYTVQLSGWVGTVGIRYSLRCTEELAQELLREPRNFEEFAVVASIDHIDKSRESVSPATGSGEEFVFLAEGDCKAATFVGSHGPLLHDLD